MKIKLQAFRVGGAIFRIADEMRRLPAYFDNPDSQFIRLLQYNIYPIPSLFMRKHLIYANFTETSTNGAYSKFM